MRKGIAILLAVTLLGSVLAAQGQDESTSKTAETSLPTVTEPVHITLWHSRGAGANGDAMQAAIDEFNSTNKLGITVEGVYQGNYATVLSKTMQAVASSTNPTMVILERAAGTPVADENGLLYDMMPLAKRDGMDLDNFFPALMYYSLRDGRLITLPYVRSTPVFYYNKDMYDAAGIKEPPKTIAELEEYSKKLTKVVNGKTEVYGFELLNDPAWFIQNMTYQLGSNMLSDDGNSARSLYDGTLLKCFTAWRNWVDEGWCAAPVVTNADSTLRENFFQGKLASFFMSTGSMKGILEHAAEAGIHVGVAFLPTWDKPAAPVGGGNIAILNNTSDNEKAAAWEFIKFLMTDDQVAKNSVNSGYLPITRSAKNSKILQDHWAAHPEYKVAFDQLDIAQEMPWSVYKSQYEQQMMVTCSKLIQDRSITPEQAIEELKAQASQIFPQQK